MSGWRGGLALLALVAALQIAPLWTLTHFPTQDGPSHQALAAVERAFDQPEGAFLHAFFVRNPAVVPNAFASLVMSRGLRVLSIPIAEKVLLTLYVVLLPAAMLYAVSAVNSRSASLAILVLPFTYHLPFQTGFYNFSFSLAAFLIALGYWWKHADRMTAGRIAVFGALALWVYFCHVVSFAMLVIAVVGLGAWKVKQAGATLRRARTCLAPPLASLIPALVLLVIFMRHQTPGVVRRLPVWTTLKDLIALRVLDVMNPAAASWALALVALFVVAIAARLWRSQTRGLASQRGGWALLVGMFSAVCLVAPDDIGGGGYLVVRLMLFPWLAAILWLASQDWSRHQQIWIATAAAVIAVGLLGSYWQSWQRLDSYLQEYVSVSDHIEEGRTAIALSYHRMDAAPDGGMLAYRSDPFLHASGYVTTSRHLVDLNIYGASSRVFSMMYVPEVDPYRQFPDLERTSPSADVSRYEAQTGKRIDYVIVWRATADDAAARALIAQLAQAYDRTYLSPRGLVALYRHR